MLLTAGCQLLFHYGLISHNTSPGYPRYPSLVPTLHAFRKGASFQETHIIRVSDPNMDELSFMHRSSSSDAVASHVQIGNSFFPAHEQHGRDADPPYNRYSQRTNHGYYCIVKVGLSILFLGGGYGNRCSGCVCTVYWCTMWRMLSTQLNSWFCSRN